MEFDGKVVIVTGSTSGIGEQIALSFAKNGAKVVINGRDETRLNSVIEKCIKVSPSKQKPLGVISDVSDDEKLKMLIEETISKFGKIDVLVNNAGVTMFHSVEDDNLIAGFDYITRNNLRPTVVLSSLAIPYLIASKGCIVNISSIGSVKPIPKLLSMCAANAAIDMVTRSMALELGPKGVRVNSVRVGYVKTPLFERFGLVFEDIKELKKQPLRKYGQPEDVANTVLFLASSRSEFMTGNNVLLDGGLMDAV